MTDWQILALIYLGIFATGIVGASLFSARQWIVHHLGRARPLPDLPQRDEASAPEGGVVVGIRLDRPFSACGENEFPKLTAMQGNAQAQSVPLYDGDWPKHFHSDDLPRRA